MMYYIISFTSGMLVFVVAFNKYIYYFIEHYKPFIINHLIC